MMKLLNYQKYDINKLKLLKEKYNQKQLSGYVGLCNDHNYSPYIKEGPCRFCYGHNKSDTNVIFEILKTI
jgi:hypothetical protein